LARSRTSFQPGNRMGRPNFKPGNTLGMRHGAQTLSQVNALLPEIMAKVEAELEGVPYHARPDTSVIHQYCRMQTEARLYERYFDATGGFFEADGRARPGYGTLLQIRDRIEKFARLNGLGALARAQTIQAASAGRRDMAEVEDRIRRIRQKQKLAVLTS